VTVALDRIVFHAHHGNRMIHIEEPVEVLIKKSLHYALVIPSPYQLSGTHVSGLVPYLRRHAPFPYMEIHHPFAFNGSLKVVFAYLRAVHTERIVSYIQHGSHARRNQRGLYLF
jgi:hypothetical protein